MDSIPSSQKSTEQDATKTIEETQPDDEDSLCDWDDDEYELPEIPSGIATNNSANDDKDAAQLKKDEHQDDDWLAPINVRNADSDQTKDAGKTYLTKQFQRLCTPVNKKKHRCAVCTCPLADENLTVHPKCASSASQGKCDGASSRKPLQLSNKPHKTVRFSASTDEVIEIPDRFSGETEL
ncbi:expressed unknown protein [Seminavis robusta]|uniref:Uncharacterized protein n=1 Tax=Seminavis robusta TaxID=568900 RepID=A0A9N8EZQ5_9STRA|nr:expressed unknown protein [Seminavis robusta]|eukprot:Sro2347_g324270.1 n/a (181) ;mRNA; f:9470-10012